MRPSIRRCPAGPRSGRCDDGGTGGEPEVRTDVQLRCPVSAIVVGRKLADAGRRVRELAAGRKPLHHLEQVQRNDHPELAGLFCRREETDERGGDRHDRHGEVGYLLSADAIADRADNQPAEGPHQKRHRKASRVTSESVMPEVNTFVIVTAR